MSSACASVEKIKFNFKLEKTVAAFKIATWRRKESFREEVEEFIDEFNRAQISKSADYFNDVFKSKKVIVANSPRSRCGGSRPAAQAGQA